MLPPFSDSFKDQATTTKKIFSQTTAIETIIQADTATIWKLLTTTSDMTRWNSTLVSLEGELKAGGTFRLISTLAPNRTFKLKVKEWIPHQKLVWGDAMGKRTYLLTPEGRGTRVLMTETIGGPLFPLFAKHIPSLDASFEQFMADLKQEAEA